MADKLLLLLMLLISTANCQSTTTVSKSEKEVVHKSDDTKEPTTEPSTLKTSESTSRNSADEPNGNTKEQSASSVTSSEESPEALMLIEELLNAGETNTNDYHDDTSMKYVPNASAEDIATSNTDKVEIRQKNPELERKVLPKIEFDEPEEIQRDQNLAPTPYETNAEPRMNPSVNNSPLLLTEGGYQRPFQIMDRFTDQRQRLRSESANQQTEAVRTPGGNSNNGDLQADFRTIFSSPLGFGPGPVFRHPYMQPTNTEIPRDIQNSFYNTQQNFRPEYPQLDGASGEFPGVHFTVHTSPRVEMPNPGYLYQTPFHFPASQQIPAQSPRQIPLFFRPESSPGYSTYENNGDLTSNDFQRLFAKQMNPGLQEVSNLYGTNPSLGSNFYANPSLNVMPNYPNTNDGPQLTPRFLNFPFAGRQIPDQNINEEPVPLSTPSNMKEEQAETESPKEEDAASIPFGARIQKQNDGQDQDDLERQDNVYMRYPMTEAGYATEESLPAQNITGEKPKVDYVQRPYFPFFSVPRSYNVFSGPDPYKMALENIHRRYPNERNLNTDEKNVTEAAQSGGFEARESPFVPEQARPEGPTRIFRTYPERNPELSIPSSPFYPIQRINPERNPFNPPVAFFPENTYQFAPRASEEESEKSPGCAKNLNLSLCFEDPEYPRGDVMFALNSDTLLMEHLVMPDQELEDIELVEQNSTESPESGDNYICKSDIKNGLPLRAQNVQGNWKVIINIKRALGSGKFIQPVRLEICRGAGEPCSFTEVKTTCVQKYTLQRLLSWSAEKGVHNDVFKLPVACSCQIIDTKA